MLAIQNARNQQMAFAARADSLCFIHDGCADALGRLSTLLPLDVIDLSVIEPCTINTHRQPL
jgi:hypothetical protein